MIFIIQLGLLLFAGWVILATLGVVLEVLGAVWDTSKGLCLVLVGLLVLVLLVVMVSC